MAKIKKPEWCNYSDAAVPLRGCWSLLAGMVESEEYCKKCERYNMKTLSKMYKPGQLLTINGKVYRVKRAKYHYPPCRICAAKQLCFKGFIYKLSVLCHGTPGDCYLQLITPKSSLG